jgi:hypothetical protein
LSYSRCQYSLNGIDWTHLPASTPSPAIKAGKKIYFKASGLTPNSTRGIGTFTISKPFNLSGNCMSMLFGNETKNNLLGYDYAFLNLFSHTPVVNISANFLPATTLANYCYTCMFEGCSSLITAPKLPATILTNSCYESMFNDCISLVNAPKLPATILKEWCYRGMFRKCISLVNTPDLPATTLAYGCYNSMFWDCWNLIKIP